MTHNPKSRIPVLKRDRTGSVPSSASSVSHSSGALRPRPSEDLDTTSYSTSHKSRSAKPLLDKMRRPASLAPRKSKLHDESGVSPCENPRLVRNTTSRLAPIQHDTASTLRGPPLPGGPPKSVAYITKLRDGEILSAKTPSSPSIDLSALSDSLGSLNRFQKTWIEWKQFGNAVQQLGELSEKLTYFSDRYNHFEEDYVPAEIQAIKDVYSFREDASSLYTNLSSSIKCQAEPQVQLQLSGFGFQQLQMLISTCREVCRHDHWTLFTRRSNPQSSSDSGFLCPGCVKTATTECSCPDSLHFWFDNDRICGTQDGPIHGDPSIIPVSTLAHSLHADRSDTSSIRKPFDLSLRDRLLLGVSMAQSIFRLGGGPWLQHPLDRDLISLFPYREEEVICYLPHVRCELNRESDQVPDIRDHVAGLGVLILELTANKDAGWTDSDKEYGNERTNTQRLARILDDKQWYGSAGNYRRISQYRHIGDACLAFTSTLDDFQHPDLEDEAALAVLYKDILGPLYQLLSGESGAAEALFPDLSALMVSRRAGRRSVQDLAMFDDCDSCTDPQYATSISYIWFQSMREEAYERYRIRDALIHVKGLKSFAHSSQEHIPEHVPFCKKIRIAVLDTGVSNQDEKIKYGFNSKRIKECRSWVGQRNDDADDTCGHGTHVVRLLLDVAPNAEIYVAKISEGLVVEQDKMDGIAQAIDWAVIDCEADIISMSFGFYGRHTNIEQAIARAIRRHTILIAAASNEGGNRARPIPARLDNVLCIHACDGKGNNGNMNPTAIPKDDNFTVLGIGIRSKWGGKFVYKSGTSFATPIAVSIAANILDFADTHCEFTTDEKERLHRFDGMRDVFRRLSKTNVFHDNNRDGYDYVNLPSLWVQLDNDRDEMIRTIREAIKCIWT